MDHYSNSEKIVIVLTAIFNIAALLGGIGTLICLVKINKKL